MNGRSTSTKSLLPPNATSFEKVLENTTKFNTDSDLLKGFKFENNQEIINYLIWEFSLNDVLKYIQNNPNIIANGLAFQRTRGTKEAVKIAANWADLDEIDIYEEGPSVHFYEFQIGVRDRQFDFDIDALKSVIDLAKPVRARLSRVYNAVYDIRHFKLSCSEFGDILSDDSGQKLYDLTLSFGRNCDKITEYDNVSVTTSATRIHEIKSAADRIYRLDFAILDESEPDINAVEIEYQKARVYKSNAYEGQFADISKHLTFAKAAIILSESCVLENINTCFNPVEIDEKDATFKLGFDMLSEHSWSFETRWILERFGRSTPSYSNVFDGNYDQIPTTNDRNFAKVIRAENTATQANSRASDIHLTYEPNPYWSEHRHPETPWSDKNYVGKVH